MARTPQRTKGTDGGLCISDQPFRGARDLDGAREGNRTLDLRITSALLCRLSYPGLLALTRSFLFGFPTLSVNLGGSMAAKAKPVNSAELGKDHWRIRVFVGRGAHGRPKWASKNVRGSLKEAKAAVAAFKTELDRQDATSHRGSVADLLDRWLDDIGLTRSDLHDARARTHGREDPREETASAQQSRPARQPPTAPDRRSSADLARLRVDALVRGRAPDRRHEDAALYGAVAVVAPRTRAGARHRRARREGWASPGAESGALSVGGWGSEPKERSGLICLGSGRVGVVRDQKVSCPFR